MQSRLGPPKACALLFRVEGRQELTANKHVYPWVTVFENDYGFRDIATAGWRPPPAGAHILPPMRRPPVVLRSICSFARLRARAEHPVRSCKRGWCYVVRSAWESSAYFFLSTARVSFTGKLGFLLSASFRSSMPFRRSLICPTRAIPSS